MKSIFYILLISFIMSYSSLVFSQDYPPDATPYIVDTSTRGINTNPTILQKPSSLIEGSVDIRIHPSTNTTQSEMSVAISPINNQIILASANCSDYPVTQIYGTGYYVSTDGGQTWAGSDQPPSGSLNKGDPAAVIDRQGNFYIGSIASNKGQGIMKSTDQGASWSYIQIANPTVSGKTLDKNHLTVDNTTGSYSGYLYSAWSDFGYSDRRITIMRSTDHGQSWNSKNVISSGFAGSGLGHQGVNLQVGPNGTVYACWAVRDSDSPYTERGIGFNKSTDGGATWVQAKYAINNIKGMRKNPYPTLGIRTNSFPVMGINMHTGRMYIAWVNVGIPGVNTGDPDIYLIYSDDNGDNWSTPIRVNNDQIDNGALQFHIWLSVDPVTDVLYIAFYDNRENISTNNCEFYIAKSIDDDLTFINYPVSDNYFSVGPLPGFGSNYNGEYPGIAARGGRFIPIWHSQVPSENAQGWVSPETNISFTVDQQKSNGSSFGSVFHWESEWEDYPVPHTFDDWEEGETHTLRANTTVVDGEKCHDWNENIYLNHNSFTLEAGLEVITANFDETDPATIKTYLISGGEGGSIEFKDPWLTDYNEAPYGMRNRGMDAPFKSKASPFEITLEPEYKGVFLDQDYQIDPVYYSVRADNEQDIVVNDKDIKWHFQHWEGDNVQFQHANSNQTAVVFKQPNAQAQAVYKGHLCSDMTDAYSSNSQRKLVRTSNGKYHTVYVSKGADGYNKIWYTHSNSTDFSGSWAKDVILLDAYGHSYNPSLDCYGDELFYVFENIDDEYAGIFMITNYGACFDLAEYDYNYAQNAKPVIAACEDEVFVAWKPSASSGYKYSVYYVPEQRWIIEGADIPNTGSNSTNLSVAAIKTPGYGIYKIFSMAWQEGTSSIKYQRYYKKKNGPGTINDIIWEHYAVISTGSGFTRNLYPSVSIDGNWNPVVSWRGEKKYIETKALEKSSEAASGSMWKYRTVVRARGSSEWGSFYQTGSEVDYSNCNTSNNVSQSEAVIGFSQNGGNANKYIKRLDGAYTVYNISEDGKYIQISNGGSFDNMKAAVFNNSGSLPYIIKPSSVSFSSGNMSKKPTSYNVTIGRHGVVTKDLVEFIFEFNDVRLNEQNIEFVNWPDTLGVNNLNELNRVVQTQPFNLDANSNLLFSNSYYVINADLADSLLTKNNAVTFQAELVREKDDYVVAVFDKITYNKDNVKTYKNIDYQIDCSGIKDCRYYFRLVTSVKGKYSYALSNAHNDISDLAKKSYNKRDITEFSLPLKYELSQNYPNPFNPVTTIREQKKITWTFYTFGEIV